MIDDILSVRRKKHVQDLNIVPILDMLTTVIFFLLMSTSFMEYTKLTLPPASTTSSSAESKSLPLAPKMIVSQGNNRDEYSIRLNWGGDQPGQKTISAKEKNIVSDVKNMVKNFSAAHPGEKTLQVSMQRSVKYQTLISVMDGAKESLPDIVLNSYEEADLK